MVLTVYFALSSVIGLFVTVVGGKLFHQLDASVGASGPHDFAVRFTRRSSAAPSASIASRPTSVTIAIRPSVWDGMAGLIILIWVGGKADYFSTGLDRAQISAGGGRAPCTRAVRGALPRPGAREHAFTPSYRVSRSVRLARDVRFTGK